MKSVLVIRGFLDKVRSGASKLLTDVGSTIRREKPFFAPTALANEVVFLSSFLRPFQYPSELLLNCGEYTGAVSNLSFKPISVKCEVLVEMICRMILYQQLPT